MIHRSRPVEVTRGANLVRRVTVIGMFGPALRAWEDANCGTARFDVVDGNLVLDTLDIQTGIVKMNLVWLTEHGYGHHVEDDGATVRVGEHVFRRVRHLIEPFVAYEVHVERVA
jgi:hypothetical protein